MIRITLEENDFISLPLYLFLSTTSQSDQPSNEKYDTGHLVATFKGFDETDDVWVRKFLQQVDLLHNLGERNVKIFCIFSFCKN